MRHHEPAEEPEPGPIDPDDAPPDQRVRSIKRNYGTAAAMIAAAGLAIEELLNGKKDDRPVVVVNASGEPPNLDDHGLDLTAIDGTRVTAPPQPRRPVIEVRRGRRRRS